jgi:CheY-like chemotaxis protein
LGLSVVHGIVQQHGGAITVQSSLGQGSRFDVYLPAAAEKSATDHAPQGEVPRGNGEKVLYVDDEEPLVLLMTRMLERLGYEISGCTDPQEALKIFRSCPETFGAVVSDLSMPGMSGTELAREILQIRPGTPIVITSGYVRSKDNDAVRALGLPDIQLKPDTVEELAKTLKELMTAKGGSAAQPGADSRSSHKAAAGGRT